jgi:hypothetical protein
MVAKPSPRPPKAGSNDRQFRIAVLGSRQSSDGRPETLAIFASHHVFEERQPIFVDEQHQLAGVQRPLPSLEVTESATIAPPGGETLRLAKVEKPSEAWHQVWHRQPRPRIASACRSSSIYCRLPDRTSSLDVASGKRPIQPTISTCKRLIMGALSRRR